MTDTTGEMVVSIDHWLEQSLLLHCTASMQWVVMQPDRVCAVYHAVGYVCCTCGIHIS